MGWGDWVELGFESYDVHKKQKKRKNWKSSNPSAVRGGSGTTKLGTREKYGPYANLALKANKLATGEKGGYGVGGRKMAKFDAYKFKDKRNIDINEMLKQDKII
jgi:hypothetical protein